MYLKNFSLDYTKVNIDFNILNLMLNLKEQKLVYFLKDNFA